MKNKLQLIAGGLAAVLVPVALLGAWALHSASGGETAAVEPVEPVPVALDGELATTHADPTPPPAPPPVAEAPVEEVDPYAPELRETGAVRVRRLIVATGVSRHEPTGASDVFELGEDRLYAFVDAVNESGHPVELEVTFEPPRGETAGFVALDVPARARRWRTWAYTRHVYEPGRWTAVVRGPDGRVIARRAFDVER